MERHKPTISVTISPHLKRRIDEIVATGEFAGASDLVSHALSEFLGKYDEEKKFKAIAKIEV
jgi:Arc/MetJ-type ribon-helix-helix transcriptional regulator